MSKSMKLSSVQFFILTFGLATGTSILDLPGSIALVAREDAWIAALISLLINLFDGWFMSRSLPHVSGPESV
ncbi:GerAB/ArcD/ProY family transporter [Paenibacillus rhizoplanae]